MAAYESGSENGWQTGQVKSKGGISSAFFMSWLGIPKQNWRIVGLALALIGAAGLISPYFGAQLIPAPAAVFFLLGGLLVNVGNS